MHECPYCGSDLNGSTTIQTTRNGGTAGHKSTGSALVSCPDCGGTIDGFAEH
jgi:transcription elongation factor Elf1